MRKFKPTPEDEARYGLRLRSPPPRPATALLNVQHSLDNSSMAADCLAARVAWQLPTGPATASGSLRTHTRASNSLAGLGIAGVTGREPRYILLVACLQIVARARVHASPCTPRFVTRLFPGALRPPREFDARVRVPPLNPEP